MPAVAFTDTAKAQNKQKKLMRIVLGAKTEQKVSWETLAKACDESRQMFQHRFNNGLLEAWEWLIVWKVLKISTEDIVEAIKL